MKQSHIKEKLEMECNYKAQLRKMKMEMESMKE